MLPVMSGCSRAQVRAVAVLVKKLRASQQTVAAGPGRLRLPMYTTVPAGCQTVRQVLDIGDGGQPPCSHVAGLIARRLTEVETRLAELARTRDQLTALAARAAAQDPADCQGYCSIIAAEAPPAPLDLRRATSPVPASRNDR